MSVDTRKGQLRMGLVLALCLASLVAAGCGRLQVSIEWPTAAGPTATAQPIISEQTPAAINTPRPLTPTGQAGTPTAVPTRSPTAALRPEQPTRAPSTVPPTVRPSASPTATAIPRPLVTSLVVTSDQIPVYYGVIDGHLYRTVDRGYTWVEESRAGLPDGVPFAAVAIDYRSPTTLYALTAAGIYRREGAGDWAIVNTLVARALAVDMLNPDVLWAGVERAGSADPAILKSVDRGRTWGKADHGITTSGQRAMVSDILVNPRNPGMLWAVFRFVTPSGWDGQIFRGGGDGQWERLDLKAFEPRSDIFGGCQVAGVTYDANDNLLFVGCEAASPGQVRLIRSPNADAADSSAVRWEQTATWNADTTDAWAVRPLTFDGRTPKSLIVGLGVREGAPPALHSPQILVSHDDGLSWQPLEIVPSRPS